MPMPVMPERLRLMLLLPQEKMRGRLQALLGESFPEVEVQAVESHEQALPGIDRVDALLTFGSHIRPSLLASATRLKWVHSLGTGVDGICDNPELRPEVVVTSTRGIHGPVMSEMAFCLMLALSRNLPRNLANQASHRWDRWPAALLYRKEIGIFGVGAIAGEVAARCKAFGMQVTGISRTTRSVPHFDRMVGYEGVMEVLPQLDYVLLLAPYTPQTHHIVNAAFLSRMKSSSYLINIARGGLVDEQALLAALRAGQIAGAGLDVFETEPLPADSPFWELDNVVITAHQGGFSNTYIADAFPQIRRNLAAFARNDRAGMEGIASR